MKQIRLTTLAFLTCLSTHAIAGQLYLGPTLLLSHMSASNSSAVLLNPRLSIGYGTEVRKYYFAGEVTASPLTIAITNNQNNNAPTAKTYSSYGISFLPGIKIRETWIAYGRLGAVSTRFEAPNTYAVGMMIGAGAMMPITPLWDVRAEYIFSTWRTMQGIGSPKSNAVGLGLTYKFDLPG